MRKGVISAALGAFALSLLLVAALAGAAPAAAARDQAHDIPPAVPRVPD